MDEYSTDAERPINLYQDNVTVETTLQLVKLTGHDS